MLSSTNYVSLVLQTFKYRPIYFYLVGLSSVKVTCIFKLKENNKIVKHGKWMLCINLLQYLCNILRRVMRRGFILKLFV